MLPAVAGIGQVEIGQGLEPAWHGLGALGLPSLHLVRDVLGERLREVVGGVVFADVLDSIVDHVGLLG
jgi:hypothetical protein